MIPAEDQAVYAARRERLQASPVDVNEPGLKEARLFDASGRERRYRVARRTLRGDDGQPLYLAVLQDATAEHLARERADRSLRELDDWFDLSPVGMVLFDASGLLLRTTRPSTRWPAPCRWRLADAPAGLQQLLAWDDGEVSAQLLTGVTALQRQGSLKASPGGPRLLRSVVRGYNTSGGAAPLHGGGRRPQRRRRA